MTKSRATSKEKTVKVGSSLSEWKKLRRPGYFGRRRDEIVAGLDAEHGEGGWRLSWGVSNEKRLEFNAACIEFYEESYVRFLKNDAKYRTRAQEEMLSHICSYGECIDNAMTNIQSGFDYRKQEAFSTHIQDIAVRNALRRLGRKFEGPPEKILVIRSADSEGFKYGPGNVPFAWPELIEQPSLCPKWANAGSVEDFWQSNKWIEVRA